MCSCGGGRVRGADEMGECGSDGKDMDGKDELVMEDVMESHLSCFKSGSDVG